MLFIQLIIRGAAQGCIYGLIALGFVLIYTATKRRGRDASRLSQITDGKWKVISEYARP